MNTFREKKDSLKIYNKIIKEIKEKNEESKTLAKKNNEKHYTAYKIPPYKKENNVGRNDLCPCGSGKKFKKCCGN